MALERLDVTVGPQAVGGTSSHPLAGIFSAFSQAIYELTLGADDGAVGVGGLSG